MQTLFYGVFSAWVLWSRETPPPAGKFDWKLAMWHLRAPVLRALYQQLATPGQMEPLGLVEVLDWTSAALDRVDREAFFEQFDEGEAVQYFYEPFLQAFDPALRKQLGVWYTPSEVVKYMVARVDKALKDDLDIPEGLAAENVYVLDPCCGTGAYVSEVLRQIAVNLQGSGLGALVGSQVKKAATSRVFGFEIMPAPFVVAHLQVGLTMQDLDAPLSENDTERAGIFLTNALTGWEPTVQKPLPFPELEEERDRADRVKQDTPVLVILGNPPYNGLRGHGGGRGARAIDRLPQDESGAKTGGTGAERPVRALLQDGGAAYHRENGTGRRLLHIELLLAGRAVVHRHEGKVPARVRRDSDRQSQRRQVQDRQGRARRLSRPKHILDARRPCRHTGRDGDHDSGAQGRTQVQQRRSASVICGDRPKPEELTDTAQSDPDALYDEVSPILSLGLPFSSIAVSNDWHDWPALPELFPVSFPGVKTSRDALLVDVDLNRLKARVSAYFDTNLSYEEITRLYSTAIASNRISRSVRNALLDRGGPNESGFIRYTYRPFDSRWLYWEADGGLLDRPRPDYKPHVFMGNMWLEARHKRSHAEEWSLVETLCRTSDASI